MSSKAKSKTFLLFLLFPLLLQAENAKLNTLKEKYRRPLSIPFPANNKHSKARAELGKKLFFDPRLSSSGLISCASCHNPSFHWQDAMALGTGHKMKKLKRRTPTILNLAWGEPFFWDGRASTLEEQALMPITSKDEMNMPLDQLVEIVHKIKGYETLFDEAYPNEGIDEKTIGKALANFQRTVVSGESPFDRWVRGQKDAISASAKKGFALFHGKANCHTCHEGWRFTDDSFHDIGIRTDDIGRGKIIPGIPVTEFAFKTPTLRNIKERSPYMHNGSEKTLNDVLELYTLGGRVKRKSLSPLMKEISLNDQEKKDLIEFLETISSIDRTITLPILPQ